MKIQIPEPEFPINTIQVGCKNGDIIKLIHISEPEFHGFPEKNWRNQLKTKFGDMLITNWGELI